MPGTADDLDRLRPSEGARFLFELERVDEDSRQAHYQAWVLTPTGIHAYGACLSEDATADLRLVSSAAPDDLATMLNTIAFLTARSAKGKRADGLAPWPHRVLRWRGAGR